MGPESADHPNTTEAAGQRPLKRFCELTSRRREEGEDEAMEARTREEMAEEMRRRAARRGEEQEAREPRQAGSVTG